MTDWASLTTDLLWRNGLTAIPHVLLTAGVCRCIPCRPATRHAMWLVVLAWLVTPPMLPESPTPELVSSWVSPLLPRDVDDSEGRVTPTTLATAAVQGPALALGVLNEVAVRPGLRKPTENTAPEPDKYPAPVTPIFSPLPSPRMAARTASRSPDVLAQATGAVGPLSDANRASERTKISGGGSDIPMQIEAAVPSDVRALTLTPTLSLKGRGGSEARSGNPIIDISPIAGGLDDLKNDPPLAYVGGHKAPALSPISGGPDWQVWAAGLLAVRDSVTALPPLPAAVWVAGTALLILVTTLRVLRFRRRLSQALPAPGSVMRVVESACQQIGLRRVPETLMIDGRFSPMIWCGPRPRLILPAPLWSQLDDPGRRAVVFHELAHVRRYDHWVSWADAIIGSLYWWHPLVWWARRRLHAEAEVCCDAWVTSLLPRTRRAYAKALLVTRQYVADENEPVPALGIGVTTGRARRFARRLTMVMTESVKPRLSASGLALVLMMATTGWLASPAQSCPDEDKAVKATIKGCDKPCATPCAKATAAAVGTSGATAAVGSTPAPAAPPSGATKYEQHLANRRHDGPGDAPEGGIVVQPGRVLPAIAIGRVAPFALAAGRGGDGQEERLNRLEEELARLEAQLERLSDSLEHRRDGDDLSGHTPRPPRAPRAPRTPHAAQPPMPGVPPVPPIPPMPPQQPMFPGMGSGSGPGESNERGEVIPRVYSLPQGKLEALTQLMSRSDVPILVRRQENALEVHATERQHRVFAAFVRMIDPSAERRGDAGAPGDDGDRRVIVDRRRLAKQMEKAAKQGAKVIEKLEKLRAKTGARMDEVKIDATVKAEMQEALELEAENLNEQAENLAEQAERLLEQAERVADRVDRETNRERRLHLEREALAVRHQSEAVELQKMQLENQARDIENRAREAEDQARDAENRLEQLEEELRQAEQEATEKVNDDDGGRASVDKPSGEWWNALQPALDAAMESLTGQTPDDDTEAPDESESDDE